jgi:hypothetical protein
MKLYACIVPDNELLGVFSTREKAEAAIDTAAARDEYYAIWDLRVLEIELDEATYIR